MLRAAVRSDRFVGLEITIFNPVLDPGGAIARRLVAWLASALRPSG